MSTAQFQPLKFTEYALEEMKERAEAFRKELQRRRTVRHFAEDAQVPIIKKKPLAEIVTFI